MFHIHRHKFRELRKTTKLGLSRLIFAIGIAGIDTIWSIYMNSFGLSESTIGFISSILVLITLLSALFSTPLLEKLGEYKILIISLLITAISYFSIALTDNLILFLSFTTILVISGVFRINSFDILFRDEEDDDKKLNQDEGLMFTLLNIGWLIGPLVAGFIMATYSLKAVFVSSAIFILIGTVILIQSNLKYDKKINIKKKLDNNFKQNLLDYSKNKKLHLPYMIAAGIEMWWALIYIYIPLFIIKSGLKENIIGIFLAVIIIPLILFEFEVGKFSDKYGFKKFFIFGFGFLSLASVLAYNYSNNMYVVLLIFVLASIPMAMLEPLQDSYFFKQVKEDEEEKYYPIFATAGDIGSFISKFSIAGILLLFPTSYVYLFIAFLMGIIAIISFKIKD